MPDFSYEINAQNNGYKTVCGVDEAGRGPLAGPVCAAAVILPENCEIEGVNDSKKLSEKKREEIFEVIKQKAVAYSIAFASVEEIERYNILNATFIAMNRAIEGLNIKPDYALIDGNKIPTGIKIDAEAVVKGDALSASVAAASILAKVSRDKLMLSYAEKYPEYEFSRHKGYGTKIHYEAIEKYGMCEIHRPSFLKKFYDNKK